MERSANNTVVCTLFLLVLNLFTNAQERSRPNVLFIASDDLNTDLGCYGVDQVKTPNLDRLAKMGVRFDNAHAQYPVCAPSRASLMTGLRPNTTGFLSNGDKLRELVPDVITLGQFFQSQGYYSGRVGKIFHYGNPSQIGTNGVDDSLSWQERFNPKGIDRMQEENIVRFPGARTGKQGGLGISMAYWDPVSEDSEHTDGLVADRAVEMIERNKEKPFFIATGFFNPHCPYVAPKKYFDMYPLDEITIPDLDEAKKDLEDVPEIAWQDRSWPYFIKGVTVEEARKSKQAYYACISFLDAQVGKLLDALEKNNLLENTIIIFWSDHGYFLGEKGLWFKNKNFERATKVPLLISGYGVSEHDKVVLEPVELLDLYPTLVDLLGNQIPKELEGQSLIPFLKNANHQWEKPAITQLYFGADKQGYTIRTRQWRFTEWNGGKDGYELYNHNNDLDEIVNLASDSDYLSIREQLKTELKPFVKYD